MYLAGHKVPNLSELKLNVTTKNMEVLTDKGERIHTDLIICCTGLRVNTSAYQSSFCQDTDKHTHPPIHTYRCTPTETHRYTPTDTPTGKHLPLHTQIHTPPTDTHTHTHTQIHPYRYTQTPTETCDYYASVLVIFSFKYA